MVAGVVAGMVTVVEPNETVFTSLKEDFTFIEIIDLEVFLEVESELLELLDVL
tara:strand:+ start:216 stop:374 length:159 start_codon:yes stop_codon:yes gene_type:complete